jgi:hypothetical protein
MQELNLFYLREGGPPSTCFSIHGSDAGRAHAHNFFLLCRGARVTLFTHDHSWSHVVVTHLSSKPRRLPSSSHSGLALGAAASRARCRCLSSNCA